MKLTVRSAVVLGALMLAAAGVTHALTPTVFMHKQRPQLTLEQIVPAQFGRWREQKQMAGAVVNPQQAAELKRIYTQTLSRTYVNDQGEQLMLSIAYGADQRDGMAVHYPEVCYPAQGFQLTGLREDFLQTSYGPIHVKRMESQMGGQRYEPVTYWTTVGDRAITGGMQKKLAEMEYGFHGQIPDGLLFRVSTIDRDSAASFRLQDAFVRELMVALPDDVRLRLAGLPPRVAAAQ